MTTSLLQGGERVTLPVRPLMIRLQTNKGLIGHRLKASVPIGEATVVVRSGLLILPQISQTTTVTLWPQEGQVTFPAKSELVITVGPAGMDPGADSVQLSVDASGLSHQDLLVLEPFGGLITISAPGQISDGKLPPTAEVARDIARELLGTSRLAPGHAVDLVIGVDSSPSMRSFVADGTVESLLNVFAGVASVVDPNGLLEAVLCGRHVVHLDPEPLATFAATTASVLMKQPLLTGSHATALAGAPENTVVYLVTDGLPPDLMQPSEQPVHLVMLSDDGFDWPGLTPSWLRATMLSLPVDRESKWDSQRCRPLVESLLNSYHDSQKVLA